MDRFVDMLVKFLVFAIVFGSIIFLSYVTTKFVANKSGRAMKGKYINIIETVSLGIEGRLHLIRVGEDFILISSSGKNIQMLSKVSINDYSEEISSENVSSFAFKEIFERYIQNFKGKQNIEKNIKSEVIKDNIKDDRFQRNIEKLRKITAEKGKRYATGGDENTNEKKR
ncbi:flagellar biosynthetic protein FliO [Acetivibrio clariflavus]|uniref:flagellar biosynthetic protein FliO n=1 Tax=Acetivibrio clariflavus TaxID=288965 RepID=UPI000489B86D|nr:flagellar biosynthetic protein FliO [Acetivibrio clariflavus]